MDRPPTRSGPLLDFVELAFRPTLIALEATSRARDESYLRTHILPVFGATPMASIDHATCPAWASELATRRAPATVVKAAQIMNKVMAMAVRTRVVVSNPMTGIRLPSIEESEDVYLTPAQIQDLADAMEEVAPRYRALVFVGCYCGPRIGELCALCWSDLDFFRRTLTIARKVVEVSGHGLIEEPTKTKAGRRTVTAPRLVLGELELHAERFPGTGLIFT
ncbi:MAG: tyrosine-type recombinase/integrase, partial [Acidimicrobiales bacterium]